MRIRWASSSHLEIASSNIANRPSPIPNTTPAFAAQKKLTRHGRELKRARTLSRAELHHSVIMAKNAAVKKEKAKVTKNHKANAGVGYSYVYVGNIDPIIGKEDLEAFFKSCGPVSCIQIRCSRGQAINKEFSDSKAVQKAVQKNGDKLKGCRLVVSVSPGDLPEVRDILKFREAKRLGLPNLYNLGDEPSRPIQIEPTEQVIVTPHSDRHRFMGVSFAKCIA
ncbi:hypothetical protein L208DRAFT_36376 [Tricholoma matsutake]|nr:hypothetical protein L208DRAFT_36376 [Tricholoma matsutake 945]